MDKNNITSVKIPAGAFADTTVLTDVSIGTLMTVIVMAASTVRIMILTTIRESAKDVLVMKTNCFDCTEGVPHDVAFL